MNRVIGTIFALASLAVIAYAIYNAGEYTSICFGKGACEVAETREVAVVEDEASFERDSVDMVMEPTDSL